MHDAWGDSQRVLVFPRLGAACRFHGGITALCQKRCLTPASDVSEQNSQVVNMVVVCDYVSCCDIYWTEAASRLQYAATIAPRC